MAKSEKKQDAFVLFWWILVGGVVVIGLPCWIMSNAGKKFDDKHDYRTQEEVRNGYITYDGDVFELKDEKDAVIVQNTTSRLTFKFKSEGEWVHVTFYNDTSRGFRVDGGIGVTTGGEHSEKASITWSKTDPRK